MTIKQQGGIFGRNPTFNNITVDGTLSGLSGLTLSGGNLVVSEGNGIDFSATTGGSGTATTNILDDYEEGTWTPRYVAATDFTSVTYDPDTFGFYTKIGNTVYITGRIKTDALSGGSGTVRISNLPFIIDGGYQCMFIGYRSLFAGNYPDSMWGSNGTTLMTLIYGTVYNSTITSQLQAADMRTSTNGNDIMFSGFYRTNL